MADVSQMAPVGVKNISSIEKQMQGGYQAQGFALAQTIIAQTVNTAQHLRRAVETAFDYSTQAREAALKALNEWKKQATLNAKGNTNLRAAGLDDKQAGRIARSAATRTSEFGAILRAMDNGFNRDTLREKTGVSDIENVGFHTIVELARVFNQTGAARSGRPADAIEVALAKWLEKRKAEGHDAEIKAVILERLADVLPKAEEPK